MQSNDKPTRLVSTVWYVPREESLFSCFLSLKISDGVEGVDCHASTREVIHEATKLLRVQKKERRSHKPSEADQRKER